MDFLLRTVAAILMMAFYADMFRRPFERGLKCVKSKNNKKGIGYFVLSLVMMCVVCYFIFVQKIPIYPQDEPIVVPKEGLNAFGVIVRNTFYVCFIAYIMNPVVRGFRYAVASREVAQIAYRTVMLAGACGMLSLMIYRGWLVRFAVSWG